MKVALSLAALAAALLSTSPSRAILVADADGGVVSVTPADAGAPRADAAALSTVVPNGPTATMTPTGPTLAWPPPPASPGASSPLAPLFAPGSSSPLSAYPPGPLTFPATGAHMLTAPNVYQVVWGLPSSLDATRQQWVADYLTMHEALLTSWNFMSPFLEYPLPGGGPIYAYGPSVGGTAYLAPSVAGPEIVGGDIVYWLLDAVAAGTLPAPSFYPNSQVIYVVYIPPTVRVLQADCWGTVGTHGYLGPPPSPVPGVHYLDAEYTIVPICLGTYPDGAPAIVDEEAGVEAAAVHELMEAITDPRLDGSGLIVRSGPLAGYELADLCAGYNENITILQNQPAPYWVPTFFSNNAYNAGTGVQVTGNPGCVTYPSGSCVVCWPCKSGGVCAPCGDAGGGCTTGSDFPTCEPTCKHCVNGCMVDTPAFCVGGGLPHCTAATNCQTVPDACGNPYVCPCPPPPPPPPPPTPAMPRGALALMALGLAAIGGAMVKRQLRSANPS
jgi:hypothetical protein